VENVENKPVEQLFDKRSHFQFPFSGKGSHKTRYCW